MSSFRGKKEEAFLYCHQQNFTTTLIRLIALATTLNTRRPPTKRPKKTPSELMDRIDDALNKNFEKLCKIEIISNQRKYLETMKQEKFGINEAITLVKTIRPKCYNTREGNIGGVAISYDDIPKKAAKYSTSGEKEMIKFEGLFLHEFWILRHFLSFSDEKIKWLGESKSCIDMLSNEMTISNNLVEKRR